VSCAKSVCDEMDAIPEREQEQYSQERIMMTAATVIVQALYFLLNITGLHATFSPSCTSVTCSKLNIGSMQVTSD